MSSENLNAKATEAYKKVREKVDNYAQKGKDSYEGIKDKAASLHINIQEAVERAKDTADPYVKNTRQMAENIVESGKESAHAVASTIKKSVSRANQMHMTKSSVCPVVSELIAIYVFIWWYIINLIPFLSNFLQQSYKVAESLKVVSGAEKFGSLFLGAVDHIPIVGPRLYVIIISFKSQISQDVKQLISQTLAKRKHE